MAYANANTTLTTNFNVSPYYDDFDSAKEFYRILYKPGYAVQARELTQQQTILQNQISRFGQHVFREGSIVIPGQFGIDRNIDYVKINDLDGANNEVTVSDYIGEVITGGTNGIKAYVVDALDGTETDANTKTLYISYQSGTTSNTLIKTFEDGESLTSNIQTLTASANTATGKGSRFTIETGVVYAKEHFVSFPTQSVILNRYSTSPTCRVGFNVVESIVKSTDDASLLDPALEASNYSAPGADRLKLSCELQVRDITDTEGAPNFVELFSINNGVITEIYERSQYNILADELAKRTLDESGDYYVRGLSVRVRENLDTGTNGGYSNTGNSELLSIGVEPGVAYVKGYEVSKLVTQYLTIEKSTTYSNVNGQIGSAGYGSYVKAYEFTGAIDHDQGNQIDLYDVANQRLTNKNWSSTSASGNNIGSAKVLSVEYDSGTLGTPRGNVLVYLTDIQMLGTNAFSSVKSFYNSAQDFGGDIVLDASNNAVLQEPGNRVLLFPVGAGSTRTLRDSSGNPDMSFNFKRTTDVTIDAAGTITLPLSTYGAGEEFPYGTGSLTTADKRDIILNILEDANIAGPGTVSATLGSNTLSGIGTAFTRLNVGDKIEIEGKSNTFFIQSITDNTTLVITETFPDGLTGNNWYKAYKNGDAVDLTTIGFDAGATRTVSTSPSSLSFDIKETFDVDKSGTITYQVARSSAREVSKDLKNSRFVIIDCSSAGTTGPYNLGFSDIYQIRSITKKTGSAPSSIGDGTIVTSNFILDNGQRDSFYEHGTITPSGLSIGGTDFLLVELDYFDPVFTLGRGYFSIDSYPIDDTLTSNTTIRTENVPIFTSPTTKVKYDLRNYVDFRPVKLATASDATTVGGASTNPATSSAFDYEANGLRLPVPSSQYTYDFSYYLARKDLVVIDKDGNISIIKGNPATLPITPTTPDNVMALATVVVAPYPSLAANYAQTINRTDLASNVKKLSNIRFTMKDIGTLKNRITNLEYYASLNLLEKNAIDMQILDENGLDRFKNGIFVDTFASHALGDFKNNDYKIIVDTKEKSIRPAFTSLSVNYNLTANSGLVNTGGLITLPYTHTTLIEQPAVTSFRNIELSSYRFQGNLYLNPDIDSWIDVDQLADEQISVGPTADNLPQASITWNDWQTYVIGYQVDPAQNQSARNAWEQATLAGFTTTDLQAFAAQYNRTLNLIANPNSPRDQRVTEISDVTRTGTETTYSITEQTQQVGTKLIDVSLIPYIRPQTVKANAKGLKANTKVFVFFDNEELTEYCTPLSSAQYAQWPFVLSLDNEGSDLVTDANGEIYFLLRLPQEKRFRVGSKEVVVTDSPTNSTLDASTYAKQYFVAQGLLQQKQDTILTTRSIVSQIGATTTETVRQTKVIGYIDQASCAAYSFIPKGPDGEEGVFLTKVDMYFAAKHPTLGVWVEIREMDNAGGITRNQVPFSEVWVNSADLTVSNDASTPHTFTFPSPVFLYNNVQYAFVIHTEGLNPDTYFWISRLGETDVITGTKVNSRPLTGTFYTTNNNLNWDIVPDIDLKIKFYRAAFTTGSSGTAVLSNKPVEKLLLGNVSSSFTTIGETFIGNYRMTLSDTGSNTAIITNANNVLIGLTSGANSVVSNVTGSVFTVSNTQFVTGETVEIYYASNLVSTGLTSNISSIKSAAGTLYRYKVYNDETRATFASSNGNFLVGDTITGVTSGKTATVDSIENIRYSVIDFEPAYLTFSKTSIGFEYKPTSNTGVIGSYARINENNNYHFETEQAVFARTNEVDDLSGAQSSNVRVTMASTSQYMSPVLDIGRTHSIVVDNIINANTLNEDASSGGELLNKYISQVIELADGQDAEDLKVILTAYRPPTSDVVVWVKLLNAEDSDAFADVAWTQLENTGLSTYSSLSNRNDFKEYTFNIPDTSLTGSSGEYQYTNSQGITFTGYKYFAVKIGLSGTNSAIVPRVADLRAIALQI